MNRSSIVNRKIVDRLPGRIEADSDVSLYFRITDKRRNATSFKLQYNVFVIMNSFKVILDICIARR